MNRYAERRRPILWRPARQPAENRRSAGADPMQATSGFRRLPGCVIARLVCSINNCGTMKPTNILRLATVCVLAGACLATVPGCGKSSSSAPTPEAATPGDGQAGRPRPAVTTGATGKSSQSPSHAKWEVRVDKDGRKWFGDIPYDVFFDDPLAVAGETTPVATASTTPEEPAIADPEPGGSGDTSQGGTTPTPTPTPAAGAAGVADSWSRYMPAAVLDAEVKAIRNFLNPSLQSVGQYNTNLAMIPPQAATLAALAAVAAVHDGDVSWKADALYIRDLAGAMNASPLQRGPKFQRQLLRLFDQISDILNRSRPADLPEPDPDAPVADFAEMGLLMKRMDHAYNQMKTQAGSEDSFRASLDMVNREAAVMSALSKVVTMEGYGYEDDAGFLALAREVAEGGVRIREAVAVQSFSEYDKALSSAYQACTKCHSDYKN